MTPAYAKDGQYTAVYGTKEGQAPVPPGFDRAGIVAFVTLTGATVSGAALAGTGGAGAGPGTGVTGAASAGGLSAATLGLIAGGVAVAGIGVAVAGGGGGGIDDTLARDDDGDGVSENAGDCNDANPLVRPGGSVTASTSPTAASSSCGQPAPVASVTVRNLSCQAVTVTAIDLTRSDLRGICNFPSVRIGATSTSVAAGETREVGRIGGTGAYKPARRLRPVLKAAPHVRLNERGTATTTG